MLEITDIITIDARPPDKRASGTGYIPGTRHGNGISKLLYKRELPDGTYEIDTNAIQNVIKDYIETNEYIETEEGRTRGQLSITGLTRHLGLTRIDTLQLWASGYVNKSDIDDETVTANKDLSDVVHAGILAIQQYWEESSDKYMANKHIELMRAYGLLPGKDSNSIINYGTMTLGVFDKYGK